MKMDSGNLARNLGLIPAVILIILVMILGVHPSSRVIEPPFLFPLLNTIFISLVALVVAYVAMRSYLASGASTILLLGAGVFMFGVGSFASGWTNVRWGVNVSTTVHNAPLLLAAIFHIAGVVASATEQLPELDPVRRRWKLFAAYMAAPVVVLSLFLLSAKEIMPQFFIPGVGTTPLRQAVLLAAFVLFVYSSSYMMARFLWRKEPYLYWYSLALALLAVMSLCFCIQPTVGSPIGWVGRTAQYVAGIYFIVSVISAKREAQMRGVSLNEAVAELFLSPGFHWQDILRTALSGFAIVDTKGKFLEVNDAWCRILGYTRAELLSMTIADVEAAENPSDVLRHIESIKKKRNDHFMSQHRRKDGALIDVEVNATYLDIGTGQIAFFCEDITERRRAEERLRESEKKYLRTFKSNPACVGLSRLSDGLIIEANEAMLILLGYSNDEFIGHTILELGVWNDLADRERMLQMVMTEGRSMNQEYWLRTKTGELLLCNNSAEVIQMDDQPYIIFTFFDITERKRAETELKERTRQLEEANKELESFSYSVSHDLRAPLRAIDGYARLILKKQGDKFDADTARKFNDIRSNAHMMGQLIDDLLTFSRLGRKQISLALLDMDILIKDAWKELQASDPERNMKFKENSMPPGHGDRALIKQVLINLLSNAVKFTKYRDTAEIVVGGYADGNEHVYYIKDNGVGFDMAYCDKLFGVFQRLHSTDQFEGTGVGLATVQRIIHRHGGRVWAEGKVDEGATFYFSLPVSQTQYTG